MSKPTALLAAASGAAARVALLQWVLLGTVPMALFTIRDLVSGESFDRDWLVTPLFVFFPVFAGFLTSLLAVGGFAILRRELPGRAWWFVSTAIGPALFATAYLFGDNYFVTGGPSYGTLAIGMAVACLHGALSAWLAPRFAGLGR